MLLILTEKVDLTTDYLVLKLIERDIPFLRLNTEDYGLVFNISLDYKSNEFTLVYKNKKYHSIDFTSVYFRRPALPNLAGKMPANEISFAEREIEALFSGFFRLLCKIKWLNHPRDIFLANSKIEQLNTAQNIGFLIPPTLISGDKSEVFNFIKNEKEIIAKAVKHGFYEYGSDVYLAFTQSIDEDFVQNIDQYIQVPMIFQKKIPKKYDIRVNVIGDKVFATALLSQEWEFSKTDWRVWDVCEQFDLKHMPISLPEEIQKRCIEINSFYNLNFSAIDMILDEDGIYYFLELNPNGQWAWIEEKVGYPLRDAIIDFLEVGTSGNYGV